MLDMTRRGTLNAENIKRSVMMAVTEVGCAICRISTHFPCSLTTIRKVHLSTHSTKSTGRVCYCNGFGPTGHGNLGRCSLRGPTRLVAEHCLLDLLVHLGPLQAASRTVLHRDNITMACMHQCNGLCTSGGENDDTVSRTGADVGGTELTGTLQMGPEMCHHHERARLYRFAKRSTAGRAQGPFL